MTSVHGYTQYISEITG